MRDDRVVQPFFDLPHVAVESDWGMHETKVGGSDGGSYVWKAPLESFDLMDRLHPPVITVDHRSTDDLLSLAGDVFGDLLTVRLRGKWWWTLGMTGPS